METTLHQQLKEHFSSVPSECELPLGRYRIDVCRADELIEIQCSSLAALRDKVIELTACHRVRIVKPIIRRTLITKMRYSQTVSRRHSPKQGGWLDLFDELVHFVTVFPRPNLLLEVILIDIEEIRRPPTSQRRRADYRVEDRLLTAVIERRELRIAADLLQLLPGPLPEAFTTQQLADSLGQPRWLAQKIAYCLRETGACRAIGKQRNSILYAA